MTNENRNSLLARIPQLVWTFSFLSPIWFNLQIFSKFNMWSL